MKIVKEMFNFCAREELGKGISLVNRQFNAISDPLMHKEKEHSLPNIVLDGSQDLPTTKVPENIIAGKSELSVKYVFKKANVQFF